MPLSRIDIALDKLRFVPTDAFVTIHRKEVPNFEQPGRNLCWAACIHVENARNGQASDVREIAARRRRDECNNEECDKTPVGDCCDVKVAGKDLERAWEENGYAELCYQEGQISAEALRKHLAECGPVQLAFAKHHVVMLDEWIGGPQGTVQLRFMDPMSGKHRDPIFEDALRSDAPYDGYEPWSGTLVGLRARPSDPPCCDAKGEPWWHFASLRSRIRTILQRP